MSLIAALLTSLVLGLLAAPAVLSCAYLLALTLLSQRLPRPRRSTRQLRFDVLVPAHNEAAVIRRSIASLQRLDWPADRVRIHVIADNCSDDTAMIARRAGVRVLERRDPAQRGKGHALAFGFAASLSAGWADAVVVIDADSEVSPNLLEAFAVRLEAGAQAVQAHYGILNPQASWRTRLLTIAKAAFHVVRSRARERLGLSCGIRGNGWCLARSLLQRVPYQAYSLTEDLEYGITLGLAGHRVHYADEAHADADMVSDAASAGNQRQRWEGGRFALIASCTGPLLRAAVHRRSAVCLDLAFDLLVLPLSYVAVNVALLLLAASLATAAGLAPAAPRFVDVALACLLALLLHVLRGWQLSGLGRQGLVDLARAPFFVLWKLALMLRRRPTTWVRTGRERP